MTDSPASRASALLSSRKSLEMATINEDSSPDVSYAPFVQRGKYLYVYTSSLSQHTKNLDATKKASVMFIEDESRSPNIHARVRFICACGAEDVPRQYREWNEVMPLFGQKFGEIFAEAIWPLPDFTLYRLEIFSGRYIEGFGRAFHISADLMESSHLTGDHNASNGSQ